MMIRESGLLFGATLYCIMLNSLNFKMLTKVARRLHRHSTSYA